MTMSRMSFHAERPEADVGCDQEVNASECCLMDAESCAAWSREVVAPGPAGKDSNPDDGGTIAGRDTGALMKEDTIVLPSDSGAKTLLSDPGHATKCNTCARRLPELGPAKLGPGAVLVLGVLSIAEG